MNEGKREKRVTVTAGQIVGVLAWLAANAVWAWVLVKMFGLLVMLPAWAIAGGVTWCYLRKLRKESGPGPWWGFVAALIAGTFIPVNIVSMGLSFILARLPFILAFPW